VFDEERASAASSGHVQAINSSSEDQNAMKQGRRNKTVKESRL
jgi:hypothetical protein